MGINFDYQHYTSSSGVEPPCPCGGTDCKCVGGEEYRDGCGCRERCPGCGAMLDQGFDSNGEYHYGPNGCACFENSNEWQNRVEFTNSNLLASVPAFDGYFGVCPVCGRAEGPINIGRSHWLYCKRHKVKWCLGFDIFSSWKDETDEHQRANWDAIGLDSFQRVQPASDSCDGVQEDEEIEAELIIEKQAEETLSANSDSDGSLPMQN
jgi:hypothetical protein